MSDFKFALVVVLSCFIAYLSATTSLPGRAVQCKFKNEQLPHVEDCNKYYLCNKTAGRWKLMEKKCNEDSYFDTEKQICVLGSCEDECPPKIEENWNCNKSGQSHVNPADCRQYYTCILANCQGRGDYWGYMLTECPTAQFFDDVGKFCIKASRCPGKPIPTLPPGRFDNIFPA